MGKIKPKLYKHKYDPYVISSRGEKIIESTKFKSLNYVVDNGEVLIFDRQGSLKIEMAKAKEFVTELMDIVSMWEHIDTDRCPVPNSREGAGNRERIEPE